MSRLEVEIGGQRLFDRKTPGLGATLETDTEVGYTLRITEFYSTGVNNPNTVN